MSKYVELPIDQIELDKSNPRIANYLATHDEDDITSDLMALLLGTTSDSCASLRQSIEANYGIIINPPFCERHRWGNETRMAYAISNNRLDTPKLKV